MNGRQEWIQNLKSGDVIIFNISNHGYFCNLYTYKEDYVKENIANGKIIITELGMKFIDGSCHMNGHIINIENPKDDYITYYLNLSMNPIHKGYEIFKKDLKDNLKPFMNKESLELSNTLNSIWNDHEKRMTKFIYETDWQNALIEDKYRDSEGRINYFKTLTKCIGFNVKDNSLYQGDNELIKRCSKKMWKYRLYRKPLEGEKNIPKWQKALLYIYDSETGEIRQETNMCYYYAWYWLEREASSHDSKYVRKYDLINDDMIHLLRVMYKEDMCNYV